MHLAARIFAIAAVLAAPALGHAQSAVLSQEATATEWLQDQDEEPRLFVAAADYRPNIATPGPDFGDFPNSAYTLPRGGIYIEQAPFTLQTGNRQVSAA